MLALLIAVALILALILFLAIKFSVHHYVREYQPCSSSDVPESPARLKLLEYNVFWRPWFIHIGREEYLAGRMVDIAAAIKDYDIVCLCEAFQVGSNSAASFIQLCRSNGFKYILTGPKPAFLTLHALDSGLMILSKFPISESDAITFDAGTGVDRIFGKGAIYAKIRVSESEHFHLVLTHLQASYSDSRPNQSAKDVAVRRRQLSQACDLAKRHATDSHPLFLCGDFNVNSLSRSESELFDEVIAIDGFERHDTTFETLGYHPITYGDMEDGVATDQVLTVREDFCSQLTLDYVFYMRPAAGDRVIGRVGAVVEKFMVPGKNYGQLSDHYGITATIELAQ